MEGINITCIVGMVQDNKVYIGGDSATTNGNRRTIKESSKAIKRGEFVMGGAGYAVVNQIMSHVTTLPPIYENQTPIDYMINTFLPLFRKTVKEIGQMIIKDHKETTDSQFLIGYRGHLFKIGVDLNVLESIDGYDCIGSGGAYALGVLHATKDSSLSPEERITKGLEAASYFDSFVYPPFEIESVEFISSKMVDNIVVKANKMMCDGDE